MEREEIIQNALNSIDDGIVIFDENGEVVLSNRLGELLHSQCEGNEGETELAKYGERSYKKISKAVQGGMLFWWKDITEMEHIKDLMVIDPETGIYNVKFMKDVIDRELDRVNREGTQMGLALIDVDLGDSGLTLKDIADTLRSVVRNFDIVCRGDRSDFVLLLFAINPDKLEATGKRIFNAIKELGVPRVSIGLTLSGRMPSSEAMIKQAQRALYVVNTRGGNDISIY